MLEKHLAASRDADAPAAVHVIHEDQFAAIGAGFFQGGELAGLGAEGNRPWFLVLRPWFFADSVK
jgi:hypothetical protein